MNQDLLNLINEHPWVVEYYADISTLEGRSKKNSAYFSNIYDLMFTDPNKLNILIKYIDIEKATLQVINSILRSTYQIGHNLPAWRLFLEKARVELNSRGEDSDEFLRGLDTPYVNHF